LNPCPELASPDDSAGQNIPNLLLIGAAGRNAGKTEFACTIIRKHAASHRLIGIKVTTVRGDGRACPRGGSGCGVCGGLSDPYEISEESDLNSHKDTARLLAAGAIRVYWLRCREHALADGMKDLLARCGDSDGIVCEANSVRRVIVPGLFLVIRRHDETETKQSCAAVLPYADRIISFSGVGWDITPSRIALKEGRWRLRHDANAIILAGGKSLRMGQDKGLLPIRGIPLFRHIANQLTPLFADCLVVANDAEPYREAGLQIVPDERPGMGPLMGILSGLSASRHELNFVTACDIPTMNPEFITELLNNAEGYDAVIPVTGEEMYEPLFAVYRKTVIPAIREILDQGGRRIIGLLSRVRVRTVPLSGADWYRNINTIEDYNNIIGSS